MAYTLSNPLSTLLDKEPESFTRDDLMTVLDRQGIERITFHHTALDGKLKELPVTNKAQAERILADGERVDGSSLFKGFVDSTFFDLYIVAVYKSAFTVRTAQSRFRVPLLHTRRAIAPPIRSLNTAAAR
jgi:glutamine synthetase